MRAGSRPACATGGDGKDSMTETNSAVDRGSHAAKSAVRIALGSLERSICMGSVMFKDFVIFSVIAGSLQTQMLGNFFFFDFELSLQGIQATMRNPRTPFLYLHRSSQYIQPISAPAQAEQT